MQNNRDKKKDELKAETSCDSFLQVLQQQIFILSKFLHLFFILLFFWGKVKEDKTKILS